MTADDHRRFARLIRIGLRGSDGKANPAMIAAGKLGLAKATIEIAISDLTAEYEWKSKERIAADLRRTLAELELGPDEYIASQERKAEEHERIAAEMESCADHNNSPNGAA